MKTWIIVLKLVCVVDFLVMPFLAGGGVFGWVISNLEHDDVNKKRKKKFILITIVGIVMTLVGLFGYWKGERMSYTVNVDDLPHLAVTLEEKDGTPELSWEACEGAWRYAVLKVDETAEFPTYLETYTDMTNLEFAMDKYDAGHTYTIYVVAYTVKPYVTMFNPNEIYDSEDNILSAIVRDMSNDKILAVGKLSEPYTVE